MAADENFLSRWSRLKSAPGEDETEETVETVDEAVPQEQRPDEPGGRAQDQVEDRGTDADGDDPEESGEPHPAELIDIDSLDRNSDFSAFVKAGVPAALQRQALRKLWSINIFCIQS